jgi:poly-gamma-glutamate capsule biosynthesis protein CapA/YwtB (metallophosphatase superfamily)
MIFRILKNFTNHNVKVLKMNHFILFFLAFAFAFNFELSSFVKSSLNTSMVELSSGDSTNSKIIITIAAVGDMMLGSPYPNDSRMPPNDGADLLKPAEQILKSADIAFGNLEGPLIDSGNSTKCAKQTSNCFAFRMPTRYAKYLKEAGFDVLSLANNHIGDFGEAGRVSTRKTLDELGIKHAGSDKNQYAYTTLEVKGIMIGFIGFAHNPVSLNVNDLETAKKVVADFKKKVDILVVSFHGGAEGARKQRVPKQTEYFLGEARGNLPLFARTVIDAGASLVLGHGPHVLRGLEIYKDRLIVYSLGNFVTYGWFRLEGPTAETMVLEINIDSKGKFISGKIHPFKLKDRGILVKDDTKSAVYTVAKLSKLDFPETAPEINYDGLIFPKSD